MSSNKQLSPAVMIAVAAVALVAILVFGMRYMNSKPADPIAEAVEKERKTSGTINTGPAPMGGQPPKAGATDYAPAGQMPPPPR